MKRTYSAAASLFFSIAVVSPNFAHAQLITNGDFESGSKNSEVPAGWIGSNGNPRVPAAYTGDPVVPPSSGSWAVDLGPAGNAFENGGTLSQSFMVPEAGTYTFRFDYTNEENHPTRLADFSWSLSGAINDGGTFLDIGGGYTTFSKVISVTTPGSVTVAFTDIPSAAQSYSAVIDNVSFSLTSPIPEPAAVWLTLLGLLAIAIRTKGTGGTPTGW